MSRKSLTLCICLLLGSCLLAGCIASDEQTDSAITKLWRYNLEGRVLNPPLVVQDGVCVVTTERIYLFSEEGDLRWSSIYKGDVNNELISDGTSLFILYDEGIVEKLSCETGNVIWSRNTNAIPSLAPPCLFEGILYICTLDDELISMNSETGDTIWRQEIKEDDGCGFSALIPFGDVLITDTFDFNILVIDPDTGAVLDLWDEDYGMSDMVVHDGLVYALGGWGVVCLDGRGDLVWKIDLTISSVPPVMSYPYLFMVGWGSSRDDDTVTCVDMRTGTALWAAPARYGAIDPPFFVDNPACIATTGSLLVAESPTSPGRILVMDVATGEVLGSLQTSDSAMDFAADGTLLYCVSGNDVACYDLSGVLM